MYSTTNAINAGKKFSDVVKSFDVNAVSRVIGSFVGFEKEYAQIATSDTADYSSHIADTGITVLTDKTIVDIVAHGIRIDGIIKNLSGELAKISSVLKQYGLKFVSNHNVINPDNTIKSVRLSSKEGDLSVLVTVKNFGEIDSKKITPSIKKTLGATRFKRVFTENISWTIRPDFTDRIATLIKKTFGAGFMDKAFEKKTSYKIKSREEFDKLLADPSINENVRSLLGKALKKPEIAITYPK